MIVIDERDNVAVAMRDVVEGESVGLPSGGTLVASEDVPTGHKLAIEGIAQGETIVKYGESIGVAATDIRSGDWVHTHNIKPID